MITGDSVLYFLPNYAILHIFDSANVRTTTAEQYYLIRGAVIALRSEEAENIIIGSD